MMPIVMHANSGRIESSGGFGCVGMDASKFRKMEDDIFVKEDELTDSCPSFSSSLSFSSSIGKNSNDDDDDDEVESSFKGSLDMMDALEEALPVRRGISTFYNGKSMSFTSLADALAAPSIKDITKMENAYTRKRRNLLAFNHVWDKSRKNSGGGISKRSVSLSKSALALAVAMSGSEDGGDAASTNSTDSTPRSPLCLPPLYPQARAANKVVSSLRLRSASAWRSFSVADLQHCPSSTNM